MFVRTGAAAVTSVPYSGSGEQDAPEFGELLTIYVETEDAESSAFV